MDNQNRAAPQPNWAHPVSLLRIKHTNNINSAAGQKGYRIWLVLVSVKKSSLHLVRKNCSTLKKKPADQERVWKMAWSWAVEQSHYYQNLFCNFPKKKSLPIKREQLNKKWFGISRDQLSRLPTTGLLQSPLCDPPASHTFTSPCRPLLLWSPAKISNNFHFFQLAELFIFTFHTDLRYLHISTFSLLGLSHLFSQSTLPAFRAVFSQFSELMIFTLHTAVHSTSFPLSPWYV